MGSPPVMSVRQMERRTTVLSEFRITDLDAPGLKARPSASNPERLYWICRTDIAKEGYKPTTVRLHYDLNDPADRKLISAACHKLQAEMLEWADGKRASGLEYDGTVASLIRLYQRDEASPYNDLKWNTQRTYDQVLGVIHKAFGKRALAALKITDFRRWYDEAKKPKKPGGQERVRKAHGIIAMTRRLMSYGIMAELPECARISAILNEARFKQPARRRVKLEYHHVRAFIDAAYAKGRISLALGTAIQFETGMRQRDVIGEWAPLVDADDVTAGIVLNGRRWVNGLTWSDINNRMSLYKETTKTGAIVSHDLSLCPLAMEVIARVPPQQRSGPMIVDETALRPYAEHAYAREWRRIARDAGIPSAVWNMDARAGAITEAEDAGAELDEIRGAVGHSQASTTARYSRGAIGKARKVASLRVAHRNATKSD